MREAGGTPAETERIVKYDYLYESGRARGASGAKRLRLAVIFLFVAALTAFVIWKTIPADPVPTPKGGPERPAGVSPEAPKQDPVPGGKSGAVLPSSGGETPPVPGGGQGEPPAQTASPSTSADPGAGASAAIPGGNGGASAVGPVSSAADPAGGEGVSSAKSGPSQAPGYVKGRPGPQDTPPEKDKPLVPEEKQGASAAEELKKIETAFAQKDFALVSDSAQKLLPQLTPGSEPYRAALRLLTEANWARLLAGDTSGGFAVKHIVGAGEYLGRVARKNKTTVSAIMFVNKLKNTNIMVGQKLILHPGPWKITVSKKRRQLELWRNGIIFMGFDVGIGRFDKTPSAAFTIVDRLKHPVYRTSDGRVFQHGEQGNELGDYFLKLAASGKPNRPLLGYGIHGTADESSVTRSLSNGCVRMRNADVEKLYFLVPAGTPVEIGE